MGNLAKGTEIVAVVDGEERDGRVIDTYIEDGVAMVSADTEDPHWATGEYGFDAPVENVRPV